eukprot:Blabericola_migrator_1__7003@NODE_354_length_9484_cov_115_239354_g283_i0_p5_GENE_NODE_354_length_9484_cov_115_239354_g283_i0NODE_354_length_9484_cov_115_239354_g283_i0_p5_ORF_typecomplete_len224_score18_10Gaa1/PF04114_14/0_42PTPS_related/PF10131_9/7_8e02PTPS_related/PF10131_9/0_34_NODE_354_length_9484_cov_115_239354_g283_i079898660
MPVSVGFHVPNCDTRMKRIDYMQRAFGLTPESHYLLLVISTMLFVLYFWNGLRRVLEVDGISLESVKTHDNPLWPKLLKYEDRSDFQWYGFREQMGFSLAVILLHTTLGHILSLTFHKSPSVLAFYHALFGIGTLIYLHGPASVIAFALVGVFSLISQLCRSCRLIRLVPVLTWGTAIAVLALASSTTMFQKVLTYIDESHLSSPMLQFISPGKVIYPIERCV